jgi:transaldolase
MAERYARACEKYGNSPPIFITHISGIFDEYLKKVVARDGIEIDPALIDYAGISVARKQYRLFKEGGYNVVMMGGGARGAHHFTELVGGPHITINWSTVQEILDSDSGVCLTVKNETPREVLRVLCDKLPDFRRAYEDGGLEMEEFSGYGPVQLFRNAFLKGWYHLLAHIASRKYLLAR